MPQTFDLYNKGQFVISKPSIKECIQHALDHDIPVNQIKEQDIVSGKRVSSPVPLPTIHNIQRFLRKSVVNAKH